MTDRLISQFRRAAPLPTVGRTDRNSLSGIYRHDQTDSGLYRVSGTIGVKGAPDRLGRYRVRLICARSGRLVREMWSSAAGAYSFDYIRRGPWIVIATDHTGNYNAVPADRVLGEKI